MADIELVIKIPEEMYKWIYDVNKFSNDYGIGDFIDLIKNGTPLPKGHGAIIDIKELEEFWKEHEIGHDTFTGELLYDAGRTSRHDVIWKPLLDVLPTIIKADKKRK